MGNTLKRYNSVGVWDDEVTVSGSTVSVLPEHAHLHNHHLGWITHPLPSVWSAKLRIRSDHRYSGINILGVSYGRKLAPFRNTPFGVTVSAKSHIFFHGVGGKMRFGRPPYGIDYEPQPCAIIEVGWKEETKLFTVKFGTKVVTVQFPEEPIGHHKYYFYFTFYGEAVISVKETGTVFLRVLLLLRNRFLVLSERASVKDTPLITKSYLMAVQVVRLWFLQKICVYLDD